MLAWIAQNAVTIIAIAVILLLIGAAILSLVKNKKRSPCGCTGNCACCKMGCEQQHHQT